MQFSLNNIFKSIVSINGVGYTGNNVQILNGKVIIDGNAQEGKLTEPIIVNISGNVGDIKVGNGNVNVTGHAQNIHTGAGDIECGDVSGDVKTNCGDIKCNNVSGSIKTNCGDIKYRK